MKMLVTAAAVAAALGGSAVASAGVYDFSYIFGDGQQITGSLDGVSSNGGQTVGDISNLQVYLNGIAFAGGVGPLQIDAWNTSTESYDDTTPVTMSATESLNNFVIADVDSATSSTPDYYFTLINDPAGAGNAAVAANFLQTDSYSVGSTQLALDGGTGTWSLTAAPVPLPSGLPLLLSGLGGLGALGIGRRRRSV